MVIMAKAGEQNGLTPVGTAERIVDVLKKFSLKTEDDNSLDDIISAMNADKKRTGSSIKFILLHSIGDAFINEISYGDIPKFFGLE